MSHQSTYYQKIRLALAITAAGAKEASKKVDLTLGAGYGKIKSSTFRIANFPAITQEMLKHLFKSLDALP